MSKDDWMGKVRRVSISVTGSVRDCGGSGNVASVGLSTDLQVPSYVGEFPEVTSEDVSEATDKLCRYVQRGMSTLAGADDKDE